MAKKEMTTQTATQLTGALNELRAKLAQMQENRTLGRLKNTAEIGQVRKDIARTLTALRNVK